MVTTKKKSVACRKCHERKVRCPGDRPCRRCVQLGCEDECIYPRRDRQIRVSQSYLDQIVQENRELKSKAGNEGIDWNSQGAVEDNDEHPEEQPLTDPKRNPLLGERPWFLSTQTSQLPILIGEVADAAFATRFRQLLTGGSVGHIPRINYPSCEQIASLARIPCPRPDPVQARFLIRVALRSLGESLHIVRKSHIWEDLRQFEQSPHTIDSFADSRLNALFALGELHSNPSAPCDSGAPGLAYFSHASQICGQLHERPRVELVEISLLSCLYALCINRRHSAYFLATFAIRLCIVMGLHLNLPAAHLNNPELKEHLVRLWWTAYIMDHTSASISSQTSSISDNEIATDLPSSTVDGTVQEADFEHAEWLVARIQLAKLTKMVIKSIYGRTEENVPFLQRVQRALRALKQWLADLPSNMQMTLNGAQSLPLAVRLLHLAFNQSMILVTRPVLLHMLRLSIETGRAVSGPPVADISDNVETIAKACIRCARHSYTAVVELWIEDLFKSFDYFNTRYIFSAGTILAISSLLGGSDSTKDFDDFIFAGQLLEKLETSGSFAAMELCRHIQAVKLDVRRFSSRKKVVLDGGPTPNMAETHASEETNQAMDAHDSLQFMTSGMALSEPSLEIFLQSEQSLSQMELFPEMQFEDWYSPTYIYDIWRDD